MIREKVSPIHNLITEEIFKDMSGAPIAESLITAVLTDGKMTSVDRITNMSCFPHNAIKEKESIRVDVSAANSKDKFKIYLQFGEYREENYEPYYPGRYSKWGDGLKDIFINIVDTKNWRKDITEFHVAGKMSNGKLENEIILFYLHNINLEKFRGTEVDKNNPLHRWLYYFAEGYLNPQSEKTREIIAMDAGLKLFAEKYESLINGSRMWEKYTCQEYMILDHEIDILHARMDVKDEVAKAMFAEGIDFDVIRRILKMTPDNLEKLKNEAERKQEQ